MSEKYKNQEKYIKATQKITESYLSPLYIDTNKLSKFYIFGGCRKNIKNFNSLTSEKLKIKKKT